MAATVDARRRRPRFDGAAWRGSSRADAVLLALFGGLSVWVLAIELWMVTRYGGVWTGTDGIAAQDQMQYLAWIRDASQHGLASNLFEIGPRPHDYVQPMVAVSAALTALGVAPWLSLLLWKPLVVIACFVAVRAFVRATVAGDTPRVAALTLGLFFTGWGAMVARFVDAPNVFFDIATNELWIPFSTWGYPFSVAALAAMILALLCYARERDSGRASWKAPVLGAFAAWIHPWQGQALVAILVATEIVLWRDRPIARVRALLTTVAASAIPLMYYAVLSRADASWRSAGEAGHAEWPFWVIAVSIAPLAIPALLSYARRPRTFLAVAVRVWPIAALAVFVANEALHVDSAIHVLLGITVPLAVLAVTGIRSIRWRHALAPALGAAAVVLLVAPPVYDELRFAHATLSASYDGDDATFISSDEDKALDWLAEVPGSGGVLTRPYLGRAVPGRTGRPTWVAHVLWTPDYFNRVIATNELFAGLSPAATQRLVWRTRARFVLTDCQVTVPLRERLAPMLVSVRRFGCARIFEVRSDA
jgi:hypothetical protein